MSMCNFKSCIEIENILNKIDHSNDVEDRVSILSDLSGNEKAYRLHAIEEQLSRAETKCNVLKDELDFLRLVYVDSQENENFKTLLIKQKEIDVKIKRNDIQNDKYLYLNCENSLKDLKAKPKEMKENSIDNETVKTKISKIHPIVSDICIVSSTSCANTKKSKSRSKNRVRLAHSHDAIHPTKKKTLKKNKKSINLKLSKGTFTHLEIMSNKPTSNRFRQQKPKLKQIISHFAVTRGSGSRSVDRTYRHPFFTLNSDVIELYQNDVRTAPSQYDLFYTQRGLKKCEQHGIFYSNFKKNNPNINREYKRYTLPDSFETQYAKYIPQKQSGHNNFKPSKNNEQFAQLSNNQQTATQQYLQKQWKQQKNQQFRQQQKSISVNLQAPRDLDKVNQKRLDKMDHRNEKLNEQFYNKSENIVNGKYDMKTENVMYQQFCKKPENMNQQFLTKSEDMINQHEPSQSNEIHHIKSSPNSNRCFTASTMRINSKSNFFAGYNILHRFQLPTISSRLKQVTKNYFHIKSIPFVTTTSTTPSHNLGLNIQQVLSKMKTKHPVGGISPTLAHNMGLVTQTVGSYINGTKDTVTHILSRIGSNSKFISSKRKPVCQLLQHATSVAESELANVVEHPNDDGASILSSLNVSIDVPKIGTQADLKSRAITEWDQPSPRACNQPKCICLSRKQANCNKTFNQFMETNVNRHTPYNQTNNTNYPRKKQHRSAFNMQSIYPASNKYDLPLQKQATLKFNKMHSGLAGKIHGMRDVLINLHNDFQKLNDQYDQLIGQIQKNKVNIDPVTVYKLEFMEKELFEKEEEIPVVKSLYQEVVDLKEQVRNLKECTSMLSMSVCCTNNPRLITGNESTITLRLTKLLRQIQQFEGLLKINP